MCGLCNLKFESIIQTLWMCWQCQSAFPQGRPHGCKRVKAHVSKESVVPIPHPALGVFKSMSVLESLRKGVASKIQSVSLLVPYSHLDALGKNMLPGTFVLAGFSFCGCRTELPFSFQAIGRICFQLLETAQIPCHLLGLFIFRQQWRTFPR